MYVLYGFLSNDDCEALVADTDGPFGDLVLEDMPAGGRDNRRAETSTAAASLRCGASLVSAPPIAQDDARRRLHGLRGHQQRARAATRQRPRLPHDVDAEANGGSIFPLAGAADDDPRYMPRRRCSPTASPTHLRG